MKRVKLTKLRECDDPHHPNNRPEGEVNVGWEFGAPEVGECYLLDKGPARYFRTSVVMEIIDKKTFKTMKSVYQVTELNDE